MHASPLAGDDVDCPAGGSQIESFYDADADQSYNPEKDSEHFLRKICNGRDGKPSTATVLITTLSVGHSQCGAGGTRIERFDDLDADGVFDSSSDRNLSTSHICHGSDSVTVVAEVAPGASECPGLGGVRFESFTDKNGNGIFDGSADQNRSAKVVCNFPRREILVSPLNPEVGTCPTGGRLLKIFTDMNASRAFESGTDTDYEEQRVCHGLDGRESAVKLTPLAPNEAGSPCGNRGGTRLETFLDVNLSRDYEPGTDLNHQSQTLCAGMNGKTTIVLQQQIPAEDVACPQGGYKIMSFVDENGDQAYTAGTDANYRESKMCHGANARVIKSTVPNNDSECASGGALYEIFTDMNANGTYESSVDTNRSTQKICNGQNGGANGSNAVVATMPLAPGEGGCVAGGTHFRIFTDANGNGIYDSGTDLNVSERTLCNGTAGSDGASAAITKSILAVGSPACPAGGVQISLFTDTNSNGTYEAGIDTNHSTQAVCNGQNGTNGTNGARAVSLKTTLNAGDPSCPAGGAKYEVFTDVNANGTYEAGSDTGYSQHAVCNGLAAHTTRMALTPFGSGTASCSGRPGVIVQSWLDSNDNGAYDAGSESSTLVERSICDGAAGATGATGANGVSRGLAATFIAPGNLGAIATQPGVNCTAGGIRFTTWTESGVPDNVLQPAEEATKFESYVCNARPLMTRSTAFASGLGSSTDNAACPNGGFRLEFGYDDKDTPAGVVGTLDNAEVDASLTQRACHGLNAGRNVIINGDMRIDQRNGGAATSTATSYPVDRFIIGYTGSGVMTGQRMAGTGPGGFPNSLKITVSTADTSLLASEFYAVVTKLEGYSTAHFQFGTTDAKPVTLSFWVKSSVAGTYSVSFRNNPPITRSYVALYTISQANTWERKSITIAGDQSGTWNNTDQVGLYLTWNLGLGSDHIAPNSGTWHSANYSDVAGTVNLFASLGATWEMTGVQLEQGTAATPFEYRSLAEELTLAQRYFYSTTYNLAGWSAGSSYPKLYATFPTPMRIAPTATMTISTQVGLGTAANQYAWELSTTSFSLRCNCYNGVAGGQGVYANGVANFNSEL